MNEIPDIETARKNTLLNKDNNGTDNICTQNINRQINFGHNKAYCMFLSENYIKFLRGKGYKITQNWFRKDFYEVEW